MLIMKYHFPQYQNDLMNFSCYIKIFSLVLLIFCLYSIIGTAKLEIFLLKNSCDLWNSTLVVVED